MTVERLAYSDRFVRSELGAVGQDVSGDSVDNELALDPVSKQAIVLSVTGDEYQKMFSCMLQGSELIYPNESQHLMWLFWRMVKTMTLCEQVALCISGGDLTETLQDWLGDNGYDGNPESPLSDGVLGADMLPDGCNNDMLWGSCVTVIDGIFDTTLEVLQRISLATEPLQAIGEITELMGIIGKVAGVAVTLVDWVTDTALILFETADSPVIRQDLACQLFCLCTDDCLINMDRIIEVFENNLISEPPVLGRLGDKLFWLFDLIMDGSPQLKIAATINMLGVFTLQYGGKFGTSILGVNSVTQLVQLGAANEASNDWSILCDTCPTNWTETFNFVEAQGVWLPKRPANNGAVVCDYVAATGFTASVTANKEISIHVPIPNGTHLTHVGITQDLNQDSANVGWQWFQMNNAGGGYGVIKSVAGRSVAGITTYYDAVDWTTGSDNIVFSASITNGCTFTITEVVISGDGVNPFI